MEQREVFAKFMNRKLTEYQAVQEKRVTVTEFADAISLKAESGEVITQFYQGDVSHWLKGTRLPGAKQLRTLAKSPWIGPEVWKAAGYEFPEVEDTLDPYERKVLEAMRRMPPGIRQEFAAMVERKAQTEGNQGQRALSFQAR